MILLLWAAVCFALLVVDWCGWQRIRCDRDGRIRSIQDIHQEVLERVADLLP